MSKQPNYVFDDVDSDELYHHGILGQRWGRRRFQNEDGSWTPEGRERYGEGGAREKSDVQKYKAKVSFKTQQYKANLKSKAQKEKDKRAAKEERVRLKEQAKTDRALKKEQAKTEKQDRPLGMKLTKTGKMSDQDLEQAVNRLKLQAEYNKNYILATQPSPALVKADRFFSGPTGQMVQAVAVATVPKIAEQIAREASKSAFKYANKEDRDKAALDIEEKKQTIASTKAKTESELKDSELKRATEKAKSDNDIAIAKAKSDSEIKDSELKRATEKAKSDNDIAIAKAKSDSEIKDAELKRRIERTTYNNSVAKLAEENRRENEKHLAEIRRMDNESNAKIRNDLSSQKAESYRIISKARSEYKTSETDRKIKEAEAFGGVKYKTTPDGREAVTKGSLAYKDEKDWWEAYERRRRLGLL